MSYTALPTKNEDDPAASGDPGLAILGVRQDADASPVSTDGDYQTMLFNNVGRLKVAAMPGEYTPVVGNITANGQTVACDVSHASNVMMYCTGTFTNSNCTFEASIDGGVSWFLTQAVRSSVNIVESVTGILAGAPAYAWELSVNACTNVRVRETAAMTGTQVWRIVPGAYATEPIPAIQSHAVTVSSGAITVSGVVTANPGYSATAGSSYYFSTTATTNSWSIKTSSGYLYELTVSNVTAIAVYVKLYNKASAPTVGTDIPAFTLSVSANTTIAIPFGTVGKRFTTGIAIAVTGASAATDTTVVAVGCQIGLTYV